MEKRTREALLGFEYDWVAVDSMGMVGFFSTAGGGYAPPALVDDPERYNETIDALLAAPRSCEAACVRELPQECSDTWKSMAERGFFAYDSSPLGGPYRPVCRPTIPINVESIPKALRDVVALVRLGRVSFLKSTQIDVDELSSTE